MKKKTKIILSGFIILSLIGILGVTFARYILTREFSVSSASKPFYFEAKAKISKVEIYDDSGEFSITVKNYTDDEHINPDDISYEVGLRGIDEDKFDINEINTDDMPAGVKTDEEIEFTITPKKDVEHDLRETIKVIVTSTSPYKKVIEIPITVYVIGDREVYRVTYQIYFEDDEYLLSKEDDEHKGITLDSIYGPDRPEIIENGNYSFNVGIPADYVADTYIKTKDAESNRKLQYTLVDKNTGELTNKNGNCPYGKNPLYRDEDGYCPLGADLVYKNSGGAVVDDQNGPRVFLLNTIYYNNEVTEDKEIIVNMKEKYSEDNPPTFDARYALTTDNLKGRGASGTYNSDADTNIKNEDAVWSWASFYNDQKPMKKQENGKYSFTWLFQTNGGGGTWGMILDSFELNGVGLTLPYTPCLGVGMSSALNGIEFPIVTGNYRTMPEREIDFPTCEASRKTTILPDGAKATIKYIKVFGTQRVYELEITDATSNVVVTNGNLHYYGGSKEMIIYSLVGVDEATFTVNGNITKQSSVVVNTTGNDEIRFRLLSHYENPEILYTNIHDKKLDGDIVLNPPDDKGFYTITKLPQLNTGNNTNSTIGLLTIKANPVRYAIKYSPGNIENVDFINWFDDNNKKYYTVDNSSIINVLNEKPYDLDGDKTFSHWSIKGEESTRVSRGQLFTLDQIKKYAVVDDDGVYVMELTANWK